MAEIHIVEPGECFFSIAKDFGFADYRILYRHPQNEGLMRRRPDPHILYAGDKVYIPDKRDKSLTRNTTQTHKATIDRQEAIFRLRLLMNGKPRAGELYRIVVDGIPIPIDQTDGEGWIEIQIAPSIPPCYNSFDQSERFYHASPPAL